MGSVGAPEILLILVIGLFVLGPSKLPDAARQAGRAIAEFKKVTRGLQQELRADLKTMDAKPASAPASSPAANGSATPSPNGATVPGPTAPPPASES